MIFAYFKGQPTEYVMKVVNGRAVRQGPGISFSYLRFNTSIMVLPIAVIDANFVFNELTQTFQTVTIQGQLNYRIADPARAAKLLNFTIDPRKRTYLSQDPDRLSQRIVNAVQTETRAEVQARSLEGVLRESQGVAAEVLRRVRERGTLAEMGVEVVSLHFLNVSPTKEVARALEAEYRESLLRRADEATYARRVAAVDEERKIKEREMGTDIAMADQRAQLVALEGANLVKEAENRAEALRRELDAYANVDPARMLAIALRTMGERADKIGNLTFTPDVLAALLNERDR
ncbi:MAG: SPFH domain-containing protein [Fimbriimonas sp.]